MVEMNIQKYKIYELKNITDLCSNNGLQKPEFRFTEIKSLMRFWWRALNFYKNSSEMKIEEENIFGNSDMYKSPIIFKIKYNEFKNEISKHIVGYAKNHELKIDCFKSGKNVEFKLSLYKRNINEKEYTNKELDFYDNLLKISLILGGVGKRSRRGCGVFKVEQQNVQYNLKKQIESYMEKLNVKKYYDFSNEENKYFKILRKEKYKKHSDKYPYVKEILIGKKSVGEVAFYANIKTAIEYTKNRKFQYKNYGEDRLACPVYVTCYGEQDELYPIIVKLHNGNPHRTYNDYYNTFKEVIL